MGSWYQYFLKKHPNHARKMRIHIVYKLLPFKLMLPPIKLFGKLLDTLIKKNFLSMD